MPVWNKCLAAIAVSALFAAPAFADGTPGQKVNRGPAPVQPHQPTPPEPGCYLIEDGKAWSCPAREVHKPAPAPTTHRPAATNKPCCGTFTRTIVKEHPPVVTKRTTTHRSAPQQTVTRRAVTSRRVVQDSADVRLDLAGFSGGVGNGVGGGFYGGGGAIILTGGQSFSGVLNHGASVFTFNRRHSGGGHGGGIKRVYGSGCGGCK
ncbi:MAG: hypothetical protein AAGL11_03650 [Pseudomonadota bacterium]